MDNNQQVILASGSPRRRELLGALGVSFTVAVSDAEEAAHLPPAALIAHLDTHNLQLHDHPAIRAWRKGDAVAREYHHALILAADTIVVRDSTVLNKPRDAEDAVAMLQSLVGRWHTVYTGLAVFAPQRAPVLAIHASAVHMSAMSLADIHAYVASGEPMDKAGAYGIQGAVGRIVTRVHGSITNVVGLPLTSVHTVLAQHGVTALRTPAQALAWWRAQLPFDALPEASEP